MSSLYGKSAIPFLLLALLTSSISVEAKRAAPAPVAPVVSAGISYSAAGDGRDQYVSAADVSNGKELWRVRIFHNVIDPWLEEDVQWVHISGLKLAGTTSLAVKDEKSRCYLLDLKTKSVRKESCVRIFSR